MRDARRERLAIGTTVLAALAASTFMLSATERAAMTVERRERALRRLERVRDELRRPTPGVDCDLHRMLGPESPYGGYAVRLLDGDPAPRLIVETADG